MFTDMIKTPVADHFKLKRRIGDVGIELETEGNFLPEGAVTKAFHGKQDGSLRHGMEYVSGVLSRKDVESEVNNLFAALAKNGAIINPSYRCSTHIHENYLDCTFGEVLGTYICWALIEPLIFRVIPAGRDGSLFCVSSYDSGDLPQYFERLCEGLSSKYHDWHPRGKYSSLNISRLGPSDAPALGTLEYRVFPLSQDGATVQQWCNWCGNIKSFVRESMSEDPSFVTMVRWAEANPLLFIEKIFGVLPQLPPRNETAELIDFGARQAFELARVVSTALRAKPKEKEKKKKYALDDLMEAHARVILDDPVQEIRWDQPVEVAPAQPVGGFRARQRELAALGAAPARPARRRRAQPLGG